MQQVLAVAVQRVLAAEPLAIPVLEQFAGISIEDSTTIVLPEELRGGVFRRSVLASTFAASLEMAREGRLELRQDRAFGPIYLRSPGARRDPIKP